MRPTRASSSDVNHNAPSGPAASSRGTTGRPNARAIPVIVMRPTERLRPRVNHSAPSRPTVISSRSPPPLIVKKLITPPGTSRPTRSVVNHNAPSGPVTIDVAPPSNVGSSSSVTPSDVTRPMRPVGVPTAAYQRAPSGPAASARGCRPGGHRDGAHVASRRDPPQHRAPQRRSVGGVLREPQRTVRSHRNSVGKPQ